MSHMSQADAEAFMKQARKTMMELSEKRADIIRQIQSGRMAAGSHKREQKRGELTLSELADVPESAPVYNGVGRIFVLSTRSNVIAETKKTTDAHRVDAIALEKKEAFLAKQLQEVEHNIKELQRALPQRRA